MSRFLTIGLTALLAACSIPKSDFRPTPDSSGGGGDDQPPVLSIVASATALAVDEGATKDFTVALSQAPSGPLTVSVATAATTKLGISTPTLAFTPTNFAQPQSVTVTGLADRDTADEHAEIALTATGVELVTVAATVRDLDKVQIIAGGGNQLTIDEGNTVMVGVHLSAQPPGDVIVTAILSTGPVTVTPSTRVFTTANFDTDQSFSLTATRDANTTDETPTLTFRAADVPDKIVAITDRDTDVQGIQVKVTPQNQTITEQTTNAMLDVSLNQQPSQSVTVTVTASGQAQVDTGQLTFTPQNYATTQRVTVDAPDDLDTVDGSGTVTLHATDPDKPPPNSLDRSVTITVKDNDVQQILSDAPGTFAVTETGMATFNVRLKFKPTANVIVNVTSLNPGFATASPGTLTIMPGDYDQPHPVMVTGVHDNNLVANPAMIHLFESSIGTTDVGVNVTDVDHQAFVLSTTNLSVPEGVPRTFDVSLAFDPGATVTATVTSSSTAIPATPATLSFDSVNFAQAHTVSVSPLVDPNNMSETGMVTVAGAGAATAGIVMVTVADSTVIQPWGFPTPFNSTTAVSAGFAFAYPISVGAVANLEAFHTYAPTGVGLFRMALYTSVGGNPGQLVAQMGDGKVMVNGTNDGAPISNVLLTDPSYFLVVRFSANTNIGYDAPGQPLRRCFGNTKYNTISEAWVNDFNDVTCGNDHLFNIWITTYHQ